MPIRVKVYSKRDSESGPYKYKRQFQIKVAVTMFLGYYVITRVVHALSL